ncbi:transporter substrate-binding domain-containing protein [Hominifimenecus sp. rT4P-3]|uniref:transporter substrate-binding domain-containing protein n=1 Tax=Hominifimenecus sp. rT4P-3 TaxID=3242979 RepID=UPI003DA2DC4E
MKKWTAVLLAGVMALSMTACGSNSDSTTGADTTAAPATEAATTAADTTAAPVDTTAAADTTAAEADLSNVKTVSEGKLIVGTEAGFAPYEYLSGDQVVGVDMDIAKAIADKLGLELEIQNMDFDGALAAVQQGKVDLVAAGVSVDPDRAKVMDFSDNYVDSTEVVVVNAASPALSEPTADALKDKTVGVQQGNIADLWVSNADNASPKEVVRYTKFAQAAEDLKNSKIDCIVMDELPAKELVESSNGALQILEGDPLFVDQYAIAVQKGNADLQTAINVVIKELKDTGKLDEIIASHSTAK